MPLEIRNTTVPDDYSAAATFAGADRFAGGFVVVANNPVFLQLAVQHEGSMPGFGAEIYLPPGTYPLMAGRRQTVAGLRVKNAVTGSAAQFFGTLFYPGEASVQAGSPFDSIVAASGAITPSATVLDACLVERAGAAQAIAGGGAITAVQFDTTLFDDGPYWSVLTPSRLTVPAGATSGRYLVEGQVVGNGPNGRVSWGVRLNGTGGRVYAFAEQTQGAGPNMAESLCGIVPMNAGDFVELILSTSGAAFNTATGTDGFTNARPLFGLARIG